MTSNSSQNSNNSNPIDMFMLNVTMVEGAEVLLPAEGEKNAPRLPRNDSTAITDDFNNTTDTTDYSNGSNYNYTWGGGGGGSTPTVEGGNNPTIGWRGSSTDTSFVHDEMNTIVVSVLTGLIVALCIILMILLTPFVKRSLRRRQAVDKKRIKKRYQTVDAWLITKLVAPHDKKCHEPLALSSSTKDETMEGTDSHEYEHDEDENVRECMICMEEFRVGAEVSWSPREDCCQHVYHKECIREWLLRHMDCPYCRQIMLPIDGNARRVAVPQLRVLAEERSKRYDATNYCLNHGLVVREYPNSNIAQMASIAATSSMRSSEEDGFPLGDVDDEEMGETAMKTCRHMHDSVAGAANSSADDQLSMDDDDGDEVAIDEPPILFLDDSGVDDADEDFQEAIVFSTNSVESDVPAAEEDNVDESPV